MIAISNGKTCCCKRASIYRSIYDITWLSSLSLSQSIEERKVNDLIEKFIWPWRENHKIRNSIYFFTCSDLISIHLHIKSFASENFIFDFVDFFLYTCQTTNEEEEKEKDRNDQLYYWLPFKMEIFCAKNLTFVKLPTN